MKKFKTALAKTPLWLFTIVCFTLIVCYTIFTSPAPALQVFTAAVSSEGENTNGLININTATLAQLCTLPGIGEGKASAIINYRDEHGPFEKIEDLLLVPGIGDKIFENIKSFICV